MTDRRSDQGFSVAPRALGGSRRRGHPLRRFAVPIVVAIGGGLLALGWLGPRLGERPHLDVAYFGTPTPIPTLSSPTLRPTPPEFASRATALPAVTRNDGGRLTSKVGVFGDGFRVVDLATGGATPALQLLGGQDVLVRAATGSGWVCLCMEDSGDELGNITRAMTFGQIDPEASQIVRTPLATLGASPRRLVSVQVDVDIAADGRTAVVAFMELSRTDWTYSIARFDFASGVLGPLVRLSTEKPPPVPAGAPSPTPAPEGEPSFPTIRMNIAGPTVRVAPDGRTAYVWSTEQLTAENGNGAFNVRAWRVAVDDSSTGVAAAPAPSFESLPPYCTTGAFFGSDRFVTFCPAVPTDGGAEPPPQWRYMALDRDGRVTEQREIRDDLAFSSDLLFDTANDAVWAWDSTALGLAHIDLTTVSIDRIAYDPNVDVATGSAKIRSSAPIWVKPGSPLNRGYPGQMAGAADGSRLYLLGYAPEPNEGAVQQKSLGVFVVDTATESLVQRWDPDASYTSIQPILGGTVVVAGGAPGADAAGMEAPWEGSLTFHDARDGRILLRLGQLGQAYGESVMEP